MCEKGDVLGEIGGKISRKALQSSCNCQVKLVNGTSQYIGILLPFSPFTFLTKYFYSSTATVTKQFLCFHSYPKKYFMFHFSLSIKFTRQESEGATEQVT